MKDKRFKVPVVLEPRLGRFREIRTTREAAEMLLRRWPVEQSPKRRKAMSSCLSVLKGEARPYVARRALVEAAREARLLTDEEGRTSPRGDVR
jgi:hypothetical protein